MKAFAVLVAFLVASAEAFAPSASFAGKQVSVAAKNDSALSMAMERSYIMVRRVFFSHERTFDRLNLIVSSSRLRIKPLWYRSD